MATFYSIVYANIRPSVDERVSIALLLRNENEIIFKHAPKKMDFLRHILSPEAFSLLQTCVKNLDQYIANPEEVNKKYGYNMAIEPFNQRFLEKSYVAYLSKYSNNLLSFSAPTAIDVAVNDHIFTKLFQKYVHTDWSDRIRQQRSSVFKQVEEELYPKINTHVNINQTLTTDLFPGLLKSTRVDFIGQNDKAVIGQVIDFSNKSEFVLESYINRLYGIDKAFEAKGYQHSKYFIIGQEPPQSLKEQHNFWNQVRQASLFQVVPVDETELIDKYMDEHDVKPFISDESSQLQIAA
jgi:hypothetical protein